jgi:hypothetical protein
MLRDMGLHCLFGVASSLDYMAHRDVSMVCRGFVVSSLVMLGGFLMMKRRMLQVFCDLLVMSCGLLRHAIFLRLNDRLPDRLIANAGDRRHVPMEEPH